MAFTLTTAIFNEASGGYTTNLLFSLDCQVTVTKIELTTVCCLKYPKRCVGSNNEQKSLEEKTKWTLKGRTHLFRENFCENKMEKKVHWTRQLKL